MRVASRREEGQLCHVRRTPSRSGGGGRGEGLGKMGELGVVDVGALVDLDW